MMALIDRCLALNPSYARGWFLSGAIRVHAGQPDVAIEHVENSLRLSPRDRLGAHFSVIGSAHFFARRFEEAVPKLLVAIQEHATHTGFLSHAMRIWGGSTKREISSSGYGRLRR